MSVILIWVRNAGVITIRWQSSLLSEPSGTHEVGG
jgi:hypothetical protein